MRKRNRTNRKEIIRQIGLGLLILAFLMLSGSRIIFAGDGTDPDGEKEKTLEEEKGQKDEQSAGQPGDSGEKIWTPPQMICSPPDGENGWYIMAPQIRIVHTDPSARTQYKVTAPSGKVEEGLLETETPEEKGEKEPAAVQILPADSLEEGKNVIELRMVSDETGEEVFYSEEEILLDLTPPEKVEIQFPETGEGKETFFHSSTEVLLKSGDAGSGVAQIRVSLEEDGRQREETIEGGWGTIQIEPGFSGRLSVFSVDRAGRKSEAVESEPILCEDQEPEIRIETGGGGGKWKQDAARVQVYVEDVQGQYGFSSGLASILCSAGKETVVERNWQDGGEAVFSESFSFTVQEKSIGGNSIPITVRVRDRAGNQSVLTKEVWIDGGPPEVEIRGVGDGMITTERGHAVFVVRDENILKNWSLTVLRTDMNGKQEEIVKAGEDGWSGTDRQKKTEMDFPDDGKYTCMISAADASGRQTERTLSFIVDQTDPVIRYVEQLDGAYVPYFQWNYGKDMIGDLTEYTYTMSLDGGQYLPGKRITEEGVHALEVRARDQAGNESAAAAVFTIDHTPPEINWGKTKDGGVYRERVQLTVSVKGPGERLESVSINGERRSLDYESTVFQWEIAESGEYVVRVRAEDLAGNRKEEEISFMVKKGKGVLSLFPGISGEPGAKETENPAKTGGEYFAALAVLAVAGTVLYLVFFVFGKSRWMKKQWKSNR